VRLSPHSAPIRQTCRPYGLSVTRIEVLLFPVASGMRPPDPTPSLQLHYEPSSLLRVGPPQGSASVRSPRGCRRLGFSLRIRATGDLLLKADPEGPTLIYCAACDPHGYLVHVELLIRAHLQHTMVKKLVLVAALSQHSLLCAR